MERHSGRGKGGRRKVWDILHASEDVYFVEVQERRKRRLYRIYRIISGIISVLLVEIHDDNDEEINLLLTCSYAGATKQKNAQMSQVFILVSSEEERFDDSLSHPKDIVINDR